MHRGGGFTIAGLLLLAIGGGVRDAAAQSDRYPRMAPIGEYLMADDAEVRLARSAAPPAISDDATILILRRQGYDTAVVGRNGFVCMVARSWMAAFDWPEFWNPQVRAADCMNRQAARTLVPLVLLRSRLAMAGRSKEEMLTATKEAFANGQVPQLESGAMHYMMSRSSYLTDEGDHNAPHLMFLTRGIDAADWGAGADGSPVMSAPYWFFGSTTPVQTEGLPPFHVFLIGVPAWSDGTPASKHDE